MGPLAKRTRDRATRRGRTSLQVQPSAPQARFRHVRSRGLFRVPSDLHRVEFDIHEIVQRPPDSG